MTDVQRHLRVWTILALVSLGIACQTDDDVWTWLPPEDIAHSGVWAVERAGWRIVGDLQEDGQQITEWAWLVELRPLPDTSWIGRSLFALHLEDSGGLGIDSVFYARGAEVVEGDSLRSHRGRARVPTHRLTDDARLRIAELGSAGCSKTTGPAFQTRSILDEYPSSEEEVQRQLLVLDVQTSMCERAHEEFERRRLR